VFGIFNFLNNIQFVPDIKIGDILTTFTIVITLFSILYSLQKERALRQKEQADKVRTAGAKTIAKLDRWRDLSLGMFQYFQPIFVDASEKLSIAPNAELVRDFLWKKLNESRINTSEKILQENIETAYVDLYGYYPQIKPLLEEVITLLKKEEDLMFRDLLMVTQADIRYFRDKKEGYRTAELGNRLRKHSKEIRDKFEKRINNILNPIGDLLFKLILKPDKELVVGHELISGEIIKFPSFDPDAYSDIVEESKLEISQEESTESDTIIVRGKVT
jgi:hypothetical protein